MKAVLVALVVFAAVLGAQAKHLADVSSVAVLESGLKDSNNLPECLITLALNVLDGMGHITDCFRSNENGPLGQFACAVGNVGRSAYVLGRVLLECIDH
ncbi:GTP-binding protein ypt1 [Frankliniella fusca]|uniref:GTP-binding protein ypt1 n=1 Tax=Frankliniella fusca TaxID=407009 RepID=A0AAE1HXM4_9NEOP|nr:GTP-binding protein ypt1 [Frankliniella fusca]